MGKRHFSEHHRNEPRINRCLRCLLKERNDVIDRQYEKIEDLRMCLDEEEDRSDRLLDRVKQLENELKNSLEAKSYYKQRSRRSKH